jgi:multisubunit Na+/H+ antiporter MnhB subunit
MMEISLLNLLDLLLALMVLGLGWAAVSSPDLKRGVALFIAFGLLLAIVWARLKAPDLALAEAAIGAGMSGALLLSALRNEPAVDARSDIVDGPLSWLLGLVCIVVAGAIAWALFLAMEQSDSIRLADEVTAKLDQSGVSNPVTAVLLNFRAYDTLLELAVLLAAVLGILALGPARKPYRVAGLLLGGLVHWLVPLLVLTAAYLLWVGGHAPGGAFQAGTMLAAAAVMLFLGGRADAGLPRPMALRWLLGAGIGAFMITGLLVTAADLAFLQYPAGWAGGLILFIETAATLSIAVMLALAYIGGRPPAWEPAAPADTLSRSAGPHE